MLFRLILIISLVTAGPLKIPSLSDIQKLADFASELGKSVKEAFFVSKEYYDKKPSSYLVWMEASEVHDTLAPLKSSMTIRKELVEKVKTWFDNLYKIISKVNKLWDTYVSHLNERSHFGKPLNSFIRSTTGQHRDGLQNLLEGIHQLIVPIKTGHIRNNAFLAMLEERNNTGFNCTETTPQQRTIYQIYYTLALTELRGYVMTGFSHALRLLSQRGNISAEVDKAEARFVLRTRNYLVAAKEAMKLASKQFRRCEPKEGYKRGVSFGEFEGLFQTFIENEQYLNPDDRCLSSCETALLGGFKNRDFHNGFSEDKPCKGHVVDCWSPGDRTSMCKMPWGNPRRYQWIKSNGITYGDNSSCPGEPSSVERFQYWFEDCDYCICTCEPEQLDYLADGTISLRASRTNIKQSMVMIGVRLVKRYGMIHIQALQGKLLSGGRIAKANQTWVPLEEFRYAFKKTDDDADAYDVKIKGSWERLKLGEDYAVIRRDQNRVNLDDVMVPHGNIVTGVRFRQVKKESQMPDNPIKIGVLSTPFDYDTGLTSCSSSIWVNARKRGRRNPVKFNNPDIPTKYLHNIPTTEDNLYVKFRASDLKKDAGQSTIPFWDTRGVVIESKSPLQGVGLFFKGHEQGEFGGFLALRIYTLNSENYLESTLTEIKQQEYNLSYPEPLYSPEDSNQNYYSLFNNTEK